MVSANQSIVTAGCLAASLLDVGNASVLPVSSPAPFTPSKVKTFIENKCFNPFHSNAGLWSYEGHLVDPSNGRKIAHVEGIELVRPLSLIDRPINKNSEKDIWRMIRGLRRLEDLKTRALLSSNRNSSTSNWDFSGTVLSRKLFCYSPVDQNGKLLKEYRLHPTAPVRKVKTEEAVALYDTATTYVSRCDGEEMVVITEFPDGHYLSCVASTSGASEEDERGAKTFDFTLYARRRGKEDLSLPPKLTNNSNLSTLGKNPPRSKFVQFGKDNQTEDQKFGVRETYSYQLGGSHISTKEKIHKVLNNAIEKGCEFMGLYDVEYFSRNVSTILPSKTSDSTVRYSRYGEAPPWYGPGRMCTLELWGKRIDSLSDAPPLVAAFGATRIPGFLSVNTPIPSIEQSSIVSKLNKNINTSKVDVRQQELLADEIAIRAVNWFRGKEGSLPLKVLQENDDYSSHIATILDHGLSFAQKLRSATTLKSVVEGASSQI